MRKKRPNSIGIIKDRKGGWQKTRISLQAIVGWAGPSWSVMDAAVTNDLAGFRC